MTDQLYKESIKERYGKIIDHDDLLTCLNAFKHRNEEHKVSVAEIRC